MENSDFVERFIEVCGTSQARGISLQLGIPYQTARNYLKGRLPDISFLRLISDKTSCSIHWLLTGEGEKYIVPPPNQDTLLSADEIKEFVRYECLKAFRELLDNQIESAQEKIVVLTSAEIKEESLPIEQKFSSRTAS